MYTYVLYSYIAFHAKWFCWIASAPFHSIQAITGRCSSHRNDKRGQDITIKFRKIVCVFIKCVTDPGRLSLRKYHYDDDDVIIITIASQITSLTNVYSTVYSDADQRKHHSSASLAFVWGIHRGPVNSPHKWPVTRKMFPFDDVIMMFPPGLCVINEWPITVEAVTCSDWVNAANMDVMYTYLNIMYSYFPFRWHRYVYSVLYC